MPAPDPRSPELAQLQSELRDLRKFKDSVETRGAATSKVKIFLAKLWAGPELSKSLEAWMMVKETGDSAQTITATANLIAAILRRLMRVSFIFILLASIPIVLIIWQNIIMERQNQSLINQIKAERTASSNQQVTDYLKLLLSSDQREVTAAEGLLASDVVNRDIAVEKLAAFMTSSNPEFQCSSLRALARIVEVSPELTLKNAIAPLRPERAILSDLQCENIDFTGVDFGSITFLDIGFPHANFDGADLSEVEFQTSNLRHSDFSKTQLCRGKTTPNCIKFVETDLSFSSLTFTHRSKDVFHDGTILKGAQLNFDRAIVEEAEPTIGFRRATQTVHRGLIVPKISPKHVLASGVCYESSFSQCYRFHKAKDLGQLDAQKLNNLKQSNCPIGLDGPIVLTSVTGCKNLGLEPRW